MAPAHSERYTIRRRVFKIFGAGFQIFDAAGVEIGYCAQKAFRLREDLRVYKDSTGAEELFRIGTRQIIDWGATYVVNLPTGDPIGSFRRRGMKSLIRDTWLVFDADGAEIGRIEEDSAFKAGARRLMGDYAFLFPQKLHIRRTSDGALIATYRTHFNLFVHKLGITVHEDDESIDDLLIIGGGVLLAAIEGRQG